MIKDFTLQKNMNNKFLLNKNMPLNEVNNPFLFFLYTYKKQ